MTVTDSLTHHGRTWVTVAVLVAFCVVVAAAAFLILDDGGSVDPEATARTMIEDELAANGLADVTVNDVSCVDETDRRFECVVTFTQSGVEQRVAGTLLCGDDGECLWRGQFAGG